ncbi:stage II sporulation protein M [Candidatus Woesearchaeota archaeon]|nr:stage II sporulation protein M [Candidatus Woesearchaeota archaeon]
MVLELLINPKKVSGKPWEMFFIGFMYSFIALFLSLWIFKGYASIVMVTFTVIASVPFVHRVIELEEKKDLVIKKEKNLLREHKKAISIFMFLFLGFVSSFCLLYVFLPAEVTQSAFGIQIETIVSVNPDMPTGNFVHSFNLLSTIYMNNLKILFFCVAFSFFYGAGAIFILTWNASVMAAAIGAFIKNNLLNITSAVGYLQITSLGLLMYLTHGIPEIVAYFIGGLASGIISFAVIRHDFSGKRFKHIILDALDLILISMILLLVAALMEVFIVPFII